MEIATFLPKHMLYLKITVATIAGVIKGSIHVNGMVIKALRVDTHRDTEMKVISRNRLKYIMLLKFPIILSENSFLFYRLF